MTRSGIILVSILALHARTCGSDEASVDKPLVETREVQVDLSDPYAVAGKALEAYRDQDLETYSALLVEPPGPGATAKTVFKYELAAIDEIQGLYFLDDGKTIAAVIRHAEGEILSLWFRIVRTKDGFRVERMLVTDETPPTDTPVEG